MGFGVSKPEHVAALAPYVEAVVVGSAIVRQIERDPAKLELFMRDLTSPLGRQVCMRGYLNSDGLLMLPIKISMPLLNPTADRYWRACSMPANGSTKIDWRLSVESTQRKDFHSRRDRPRKEGSEPRHLRTQTRKPGFR